MDEKNNDEVIEVKRIKVMDVIIRSIRYIKRSKKTYKRMSIKIKMIIEICVKKISEDIIVGSKIDLEQEIENNKEIKKIWIQDKKEKS